MLMISMKTHLTAKVAKRFGKSSDSIAIKKIFLNANEFQRGISEKWNQIDRQWFILFAFLCGLAPGSLALQNAINRKGRKGSAKRCGKGQETRIVFDCNLEDVYQWCMTDDKINAIELMKMQSNGSSMVCNPWRFSAALRLNAFYP
jgi:hypothetical protein